MVPVPERYELFDHIREVAGLRLSEVVADLLPRVAEHLAAPAASSTLQVGSALSEAAQVLLEEIDIRCDSAVGVLDEFHFRSLQSPSRGAGGEGAFASSATASASATRGMRPFELITDADLNDQIVAQTLAGRSREALEEAYPAYLSRLARLTGTAADEDNCPLGAKALATALVTAVRPFSSYPLTREAIESALLKHATIPIREIIAAADRTMVERGVLSTLPRIVVFPGLKKAVEGPATPEPATSVAPAGGAREGPSSEPRPSEVADGDDGSSPPAGRSGFSGSLAFAARKVVGDMKAATILGAHPLVGSRDSRAAFRQAETLPGTDSLERDAIAFAHQVGHPPFSTPARQSFFNQLRQRMQSAQAEPAHLATLDLVAAMFDYATDHERIPDPAKPLLWRLQLPSVTLACLDPGYLSDEPRSIRRLVEHVAAIATAYPDDVARGSELHGRLQTVVRAVEVVAHAFQVRSQVLSEQVKIEYQRAVYGMSQLVSKVTRERRELESNSGRRNRRDYRRRPSREREFEISGKIEKLLADRLQDRAVPESVSEFITGVWLRHLRTAVLRDGEESAGYQAALKVVDDLLWTIDGAGQRRSRSELAHRIPSMLKILTQGISDIGARAEDYQPFFDEMFLIHLRRMQKRRKSEGEGAPIGGEDLPVLSDRVAAATPSPPARPAPKAAPAAPASAVPPPGGARSHPVPASEPVAQSFSAKAPAKVSAPAAVSAPTAQGPDAQTASELKLRRLIDDTSLADAPRNPERLELPASDLARDLAPGQWLELITSKGAKILAKVAWINERRSVVLLLQHPDRLILSRHVAALKERAERKRVFRVR